MDYRFVNRDKIIGQQQIYLDPLIYTSPCLFIETLTQQYAFCTFNPVKKSWKVQRRAVFCYVFGTCFGTRPGNFAALIMPPFLMIMANSGFKNINCLFVTLD